MKHLILLTSAFLITLFAHSSYSENAPGVTIEDKDSYPFYQYSEQIQNSKSSLSLRLKGKQSNIRSIVVNMLDNMGIPFEIISESPAVLQTKWISWHYDSDSKKTLSNPSNHFFSLNVRDKYKFRISINSNQQYPVITLDKINREQEVDITPDTEMVWLKWKPKEPDNNAINAFMQRLQTEYEIQALAANTPAPQTTDTVNTKKPGSNYIAINMTVDQAWTALIKQLAQRSVPLANTHNNQHMLNTQWLYREFNPDTNSFNSSSKNLQRHQFQVLVIPGATKNDSSIFVYHTAFQQNSGPDSWSDNNTQEAIAGAFLDFLELNQ